LKNKNAGKITTTVVHLILIALLFLNFFTYPDPPPGQPGVTVLSGALEIASSAENNELNPVEVEKEKVVPKEIKPVIKPKKQTVKTIDKNVKTDKSSEEIALAKEQAEEKEAERKAQLLEEARIQAEKDKIEKENKAISDSKSLFDKSKDGKLEGTDNDGENPNEGTLEKLGDGMSLGGGLGNRGVTEAPTFDPVEQVKGRVTIDVCVDESGKVYKADSTIKNTTITSQAVIKQAVAAAKKWKFEKGKKACGTITYILKLK
jgi:hypothetical protein